MALLTQDPAAQQMPDPIQQGGGQQDPDSASESTEQTEDPNEPKEGLSFTTEQLVDSFKQHMDPGQIKDMISVIDEGKQLLFGKDTHSRLMDMLEGSKNIGQDLGNGAFDAMNLVLKSMSQEKPNEAIDGKAILPAGVALIAMALEFMNESGMASVNDDTFEEASHIFSTRVMGTYDQDFKDRAAQYQQQPADDAAGQASPMANGAVSAQALSSPSTGAPATQGGA